PPGEGGVVDHDGDQRCGPPAIGGGGGGADGHLDEGVVAALRGAAGKMRDGDLVAVEGLGGGPVGLEQVAFDAGQGLVDGFGGQGCEVAVGVTDTVETDGDGEAA